MGRILGAKRVVREKSDRQRDRFSGRGNGQTEVPVPYRGRWEENRKLREEGSREESRGGGYLGPENRMGNQGERTNLGGCWEGDLGKVVLKTKEGMKISRKSTGEKGGNVSGPKNCRAVTESIESERGTMG